MANELVQLHQGGSGQSVFREAFGSVDLGFFARKSRYPVIDHLLLGLGVGHQRLHDLVQETVLFPHILAFGEPLEQVLNLVMLGLERIEDVGFACAGDQRPHHALGDLFK